MTKPQDPHQNHLLNALLDAEYHRLFPYLELVDLPIGQVLCESGGNLRHVYFPTSCIISLLNETKDGTSDEIAMIGNEGMLGMSVFMGGDTTPNRAVVQSAGTCYRLKASPFMDEFNRGGAVMRLLLRYTQALLTQVSQSAACNRHHSVEQQLCRWLLLSLDRLPRNELIMSQQLIAELLGVRREGVTEAAGKLQREGLIKYHRGHITVLSRTALGGRACECYKVVKNEFDRLLPALHGIAH